MVANALKRISKSKDDAFKDRCFYFMHEKALVVLVETTPNTNDLLLAKALIANQVKLEDVARIVTTNATIGAQIDANERLLPEDETLTNPILDSDIQYVIVNGGAFHQLAESYKAAGLIGE